MNCNTILFVPLALLLAGIGPPQVERCRWTITTNPATHIYMETTSTLPACSTLTVPVVGVCAYEVYLNPVDTYRLVIDSTHAGGNCAPPSVVCTSGDC
jgi:hypothetical protein